MSSEVPAALRRLVIDPAGGRCEYCGLAQEDKEAAFHIDHVIPRKDRGETDLQNLALACVSCSLRKAARRTATEPDNGEEVPLFSPRRDAWRNYV